MSEAPKLQTASAFIRSKAIRLADSLSRVQIANQARRVEKRGAGEYEVGGWGAPVALADLPEIDVDGLLPWRQDDTICVDDGKEPAVWPVDHGVALPMDDGGVMLAFCRTVRPRDLRGKTRMVYPFNVDYGSITLDRDSALVGWGRAYLGRSGRRWISLERGGNFVQFLTADQFSEAPSVVIGAALAMRYEWSAVFSYPTGIRLRYGCSAEGALKLFKDRDAPEEGRRKALLHWVRQHWRKTSDPAVAREVRAHLRGVTRFEWRRQEVSLIPSEYELETMG
jgi:hypothetical protein